MTRRYIGSLILAIAVFVTSQTAMAQTLTLPLELDANGHLRVPITFENGESYDFILDTGASRTGIMQPLVAALGLKPIDGESVVVHGTTGQRQINMYAPMTVKVGGVITYETPLLPALGPLNIPGKPFYGILGSDFFEQYVVEIDAIGGRLVLSSGSAIDLAGDGDFAAVSIRSHPRGIWMLETMIGGVKITALLDTGARVSILNPATAEALGIDLRQAFENASEKINGASGHGARGIALKLEALRAGDRTWRNPQVTVADIHIFEALGLSAEPAMILGSDLLFDGRLIVDYGARTVYIERT